MAQSVPDRNNPIEFTEAHFVYAAALHLEGLPNKVRLRPLLRVPLPADTFKISPHDRGAVYQNLRSAGSWAMAAVLLSM